MRDTLTLKALLREAKEDKVNWIEDAACLGQDPDLWFSSKDSETEMAKAICARCPAQAPCLELALLSGERFGVWGGMDERERSKLWKAVLGTTSERRWTDAMSARLTNSISAVVDKDVTAKQKKADH